MCNHYADVIEHRLGRVGALFSFTLVGAVGFVVMTVGSPAAAIAGFLLVVVGMNARGPVLGTITNKLVPPRERATVLSIMSSLGSLVGIAVNPAVGWAADRSPAAAALGLATVLAVIALAWLPIARRYLDPNPDSDRDVQSPAESSVETKSD